MPFKSEKQRRYMHANLPRIAKRWERDYANGGIASQGGMKNYLGEQPMINAPKYWQSAPNHEMTELAYITPKERDVLVNMNMYGTMDGSPNEGPSGIMSLNGWGDASQGFGTSGGGTKGTGGHSYGDKERYKSVDVQGPPNIHGGTTRTIGPTTPKDTFKQSWSGPKGWFGGGGYRNLNVPGDTSQGHQSRFGIGNLFRGAMSMFGGIPGKIGSMLSHINPGKLRGWNEQYGRYNTQAEYNKARTKRQNRSRIDRLRKTRDYGKYANDPEGWAASDLSGRLTGLEKDVFGKGYVDYSRTTPKARDLKALRDQQALTNKLSTKSPVNLNPTWDAHRNMTHANAPQSIKDFYTNSFRSRYDDQGLASLNNQWSGPQIQQAKTYGLQDLKDLGAGYEGMTKWTQDPNKQLQAIQDYYDAATKYKSSGLGSTQTPAEVRDYVERMGKTFMSGVPEIDMGMVPQDFLSEDIDFTNQKSPLSYEWDI